MSGGGQWREDTVARLERDIVIGFLKLVLRRHGGVRRNFCLSFSLSLSLPLYPPSPIQRQGAGQLSLSPIQARGRDERGSLILICSDMLTRVMISLDGKGCTDIYHSRLYAPALLPP
jgi:hypothetical protein